ncbi:30S ribosomal protein S13 [Candidatus Curtissbacteria bacterium]|nr:30S ribosomal protein S13 [Candidatus Curtissbacteria bacterium]
MARIAGIDLPSEKRIEAALPYIYGVGPVLAKKILDECAIDPDTRTKSLSEDQINKLQRAVENFKVEGDLRREVQNNIKRLQEIGAYRGIRHSRGLPARGQRTRTNARTKRGKRITIGTVRKEVVAKAAPATAEVKK